jgi:quinol monooxygenase YgiN
VATVVVFVRVHAKAGRGDEVAAVLGDLPGMVEAEPGTEVFAAHRAVDDPDAFLFYEVYADDAALREHQTGPMARAFGARVSDALAGPPEVTYAGILGAKGLPR